MPVSPQAKTGTHTHRHIQYARSGDAVGLLDESTLMGPGLWLRQNRNDSLSLDANPIVAPKGIERLTKRSEFLACARAPSCAKGAVVVQALARTDSDGRIRVGFTATKRIGGAVERNRAKRRMREAARAVLPEFGQPGVDYVIIARGGAISRPWARLLDDVKSALIRLAADRAAPHL